MTLPYTDFIFELNVTLNEEKNGADKSRIETQQQPRQQSIYGCITCPAEQKYDESGT